MLRRLLSVGTVMFVGVAMVACDAGELPTQEQGLEGLTPSFANTGSWNEMVTGGGEGRAGGYPIWVTVAAKDHGDKGIGGEFHYEYYTPDYNRDFHGSVECVFTYDEGTRAVVAGPISANGDSDPTPNDWFVLNIEEGGSGDGDGFRVNWISAGEGSGCELPGAYNPSNRYPGVIVDGNFNIREK